MSEELEQFKFYKELIYTHALTTGLLSSITGPREDRRPIRSLRVTLGAVERESWGGRSSTYL
jgi:hypothetical protein